MTPEIKELFLFLGILLLLAVVVIVRDVVETSRRSAWNRPRRGWTPFEHQNRIAQASRTAYKG